MKLPTRDTKIVTRRSAILKADVSNVNQETDVPNSEITLKEKNICWLVCYGWRKRNVIDISRKNESLGNNLGMTKRYRDINSFLIRVILSESNFSYYNTISRNLGMYLFIHVLHVQVL